MIKLYSQILHRLQSTLNDGRLIILATILFGSGARGYAKSCSDIDVIFLCHERPTNIPAYQSLFLDTYKLDCNVLSTNELINKLGLIEWHWMLFGAKCIEAKNIGKKLNLWLRNLDRWISSPEAHLYRIQVAEEILNGLYRVLKKYKDGINSTTLSYLRTEFLVLLMCIFIENNNKVAFSEPNLIIHFIESIEIDFKPIITEIIGTMKWNEVKGFMCSCRRFIWQNYPETAGIQHRLPIEMGDRIYDIKLPSVSATLFSTLNTLFDNPVFIDFMEEIRQFPIASTHQENIAGLTIKQLVTMKQLDNSKKKKINNPFRFEKYDMERKRYKIILGRGGCHVRSCCFCELPELATTGFDPSLHLKVPKTTIDEIVLYTDGSFFDKRELSDKDIEYISDFVRKVGASRLIVESLPCFLDFKRIVWFQKMLGESIYLKIGIGIQTCNNEIRTKLLGTPINQEEINLLSSLRQDRLSFRFYLLFGKPLLTIVEDEEDVMSSVNWLINNLLLKVDEVVINNLLISNNTIIGDLQKFGLYQNSSFCRFRKLIDSVKKRWPGIAIYPGCINVTTCCNENVKNSIKCTNCKSYLETLEGRNSSDYSNIYQCLNDDSDCEFGLPWNTLGSISSRLFFMSRKLSLFK
ncbi:MAG: hypothetical protein AB9903_22595 [Vulcanimicrobiota bacterium]